MSTTTAMPQSVRNATFAAWALLGLLVLRVLLTFVFADQLLDAYIGDNSVLRAMSRDAVTEMAPAYSGVAIAVLVIGAILGFAAANLGKGAQWARIVAVIFAVLAALGAVVSLIAPSVPVLMIINVIVGLLAVAVVVLLFSGDSNGFFGR
ncbi:hypothetical protein BLA60_34660 [Actinophytocola xinjiangensis]|uniref:Uncharacterized protein n=1 Tax=Actinophytocola xinjiangensis TaxID=485602 RepID=A0A7Z0WF91_9PSEU|nr:hypothetical protein [Actinophytocola xinjiangensis]OLF05915.1 hypothetical protein BLA60_34660 [Actinophytocola xinjiangensis]